MKQGQVDVEEGYSNSKEKQDNAKRNRHKQGRILPRGSSTVNCHRTLDVTDLPLLQDALRYMTISMAVYGSIMYLYNGRMHVCCCPCANLVTDAIVNKVRNYWSCDKSGTLNDCTDDRNDMVYDADFAVDGSMCCACDEAAILHMVCDNVTLVYANLKSTLRNCPYSISIDHVGKAVVLAIQGTLTFESAATDINVRPTNIVEALSRAGQSTHIDDSIYKDATDRYKSISSEYCHSGILLCSMNILRELHQNQKLHRLLLGDTPSFPSYKLVVTGHSLGAGVAAMISVLLEPFVQERGIQMQCMCFAPPGSTVTKNLAEREYITTVVLGSDAIPRLSLDSIEHLRNDTLEMIARAKIPKHQILQKNFHYTIDDDNVVDLSKICEVSPLYCTRNDIPDTAFRDDLRKYFAYQKKVKSYREHAIGATKLMMPGRQIIHLVDVEVNTGPSHIAAMSQPPMITSPRYKAIWANPEDFTEIELAPTWCSDHRPLNIVTQLEFIVEHYVHRLSMSTSNSR
jgi:sn1-specific diacylglycerol lipase